MRHVGWGRRLVLRWPCCSRLALGLRRAIGLGGAVTEDEDQWIARSGMFAQGLANGDWRRTYLTGHPGVTVMWLTTATLGLDRRRAVRAPVGRHRTSPTLPDFLPALRSRAVPFAVLQAGLVVLAARLAARLLGPAPACWPGCCWPPSRSGPASGRLSAWMAC